MKNLTGVFKSLALLWLITAISAAHGAEWSDITPGAVTATYDGSTSITLINSHTYRPTTNAAFSSDIILPANAMVTIGAPSVSSFAGNTYITFTVEAGGEVSFAGTDGVPEVIASLIKSAKGALTLKDATSGGLSIQTFTANGDAKIADITIITQGTDTVLDLSNDFAPSGTAAPLTLNVVKGAVVRLDTLTSVPKLMGDGHLILGDAIVAISKAEVPRLAAFKGSLSTRAGGTTDISFTADNYLWILDPCAEVKYEHLKKMLGTVRLASGQKITFPAASAASN